MMTVGEAVEFEEGMPVVITEAVEEEAAADMVEFEAVVEG